MSSPASPSNAPAWSSSQPTTLVEVLRWRAVHQPERTAHIFLPDAGGEDLRQTYAQLDARARAIAAALLARGQAGDRAVLLYPPGLDFIEAFFGCLYAGIVAVPAYPPRNKGHLPRLRALVADAGAALALTNAKTFAGIRTQTEGLPEWAGLGWLATDTEAPAAPDSLALPLPTPESLAFLQYTSGSTGAPKGVMVTHANIVYNTHYIQESFRLHPASVSVSWLPAFHDMGLIDGVLGPVYTGHLGVIMSPVSFIQRPARWLEAITRFKGTHGGGPNFGYDLCIEKLTPEAKATLDLSSWESAYNGAEPVRAATLRAFSAAFASCGFRATGHYPCFGMAETTLMVTGCDITREAVIRRVDRTALEAGRFEIAPAGASAATTFDLVSSGRAILATRVAIVDPDACTRAAPGVIGEVWVAGPTLCAGYWQRPDVTEATFRAKLAGDPKTAWLRTGDLGYLDADGELFICGRTKDLIIIRGRNHYPQDIEATTAAAHASLKSGGGAAFSVEVDGHEQLVVIQELARTAMRSANVDEIGAAIARAILEAHEVQVHAVVLIKTGTVPKTSSGKIQRQTARKQYLGGELEAVGEWKPSGVAGLALAAEASAKEAEAGPAGPRWSGLAQDAGSKAANQRVGDNAFHRSTPSADELATWLRGRIAATLKCAPEAIDLHAPFSAYGLDSASLVSLSGELQEFLGRSVPPMVMYDYPDIARLAAHLAQPDSPANAGRATASSAPTDEPIAIIGLGLRFPGGATDPEAYWRLLRDGVDAIREIPADRFDIDAVYAPEAATPGKTNSRHGGFLEVIDQFDAEFFGIAPREAAALDPQQRLLLEVAWHALENAGLAPASLAGTDAGVFVGISTQDYARRALAAEDLGRIDAYGGTGNALSAAAGRLSYFFGFEGPALAIDTACSSSLVAIHQACQALRLGDCGLALAGGVNVILDPQLSVNFSQARMLAPDGRCKAFSAEADGYVRSEGCGLVVLKRLSAAQAAGDPILAVIRGSAVNQDGRSNGLTAPNGPAQERVVRSALARARLAPTDIGYVEAHGTGTALGDPIEVQALARSLGAGRAATSPLLLGSVKSNLGHLEAAAGVASLIKTVLALRQGEIPASLHCRTLNPHVPWSTLPLRVVSTRTPWPAASPRRAGVSSFGFTGTNAHVIVEAFAEETGLGAPKPEPKAEAELVALSAPSQNALVELVDRCGRALEARPDVSLADVARTLNATRSGFGALGWSGLSQDAGSNASNLRVGDNASHLSSRMAVVGTTAAELSEALRSWWSGLAQDAGSKTANQRVGDNAFHLSSRVAFLFTGQGAQHARMGYGLYETEPVYRAALDRCAAILDPLLPAPLLSVLHATPGSDEARKLDETGFTQPALFAVEWALAELWRSWGLTPAVVTGHSVGEFVAACVAGVFSLEDGLALIATRGRLMQALPAGGGMLVVLADEATARAALTGHPCVAVAAVNAPAETVLAGPLNDLQAIRTALAARQVDSRPLVVSHAFHSPLMEPMLAEFDRVLAGVRFSAPTIPVISNLGPDADLASPAHWRAHVLGTVRFADGVKTLAAMKVGSLLEIGPRPVLTALARKSGLDDVRALLSLRAGRDDRATILASAAALYASGATINPSAISAHRGRRRADLGLPGYPFQRTRHWLDLPAGGNRWSGLAQEAGSVATNQRVGGNAFHPRSISTAPASPKTMAFGVMFFNGVETAGDQDKYRLVIESARFADAHGFSSVWVPERHYTRFGGLYPNPTVLAAALARETRSLRLMAGSLVAPLHHPLRIAEDWSVIDNLSGGRVGISFASGWNPGDFAMAPEAYADRHEAVFRSIAAVRTLWSGATMPAKTPTGETAVVRIFPTPLQRELPVWVTAAGNPKTFERAGEIGAHLLTHLLDQEPEQLAEKIALYRAARAKAGHDPAAGRVTVMLHAFSGPDDATIKARIRAPYIAFLKENLHLLKGLAFSRGRAVDPSTMTPADLEDFAGLLFDRFYARRALFGTVDACAALVEKLGAAGVNEIACLLDFGAGTDDVLGSLPYLNAIRARFAGEAAPALVAAPSVSVTTGRPPATRPDEVLSRVVWREETAAPTNNALADKATLAGTWLVLDDGLGFGAAMAAQIAACGGHVIAVEVGDTFAPSGKDRYRVNPRQPESFPALLTAVAGPLRGVVHAWSLAVTPHGALTSDAIEAGLTVGTASLLHLAQALDRAGRPAPIWIITRGVEGGVGEETVACAPAQAPIRGLARVLAVEHPELWGGMIDLDAKRGAGASCQLIVDMDRGGSAVDDAARVVTRLSGEGEDQVVWRQGRAYVPRLVPDPSVPHAPLALRSDATYLITGGLGAMGRTVAQWLVARGARHLVLTGREPQAALRGEKRAALSALAQMGASVTYAPIDAGDRAAMTTLFAGIAASGHPLAGVFHLAGLPENRPLRDTVYAEHANVFGAKLRGAWILHELTAALPLDHFVAFSSITVIWGARGQPLYAAANQFLDALGDYRRSQGLPATILNWGPWSEGGMVEGANRAQLARIGLHSMTPATGAAVLELALATGRAHQVAAAVDWAVFKDLFAARGRQHLFAEIGGASGSGADAGGGVASLAGAPTALWTELTASDAAVRIARLQAWLQAAVATTLRLPPGQRPAPSRGFFEMGMDSLMAIEIKNRLQTELGVPLRATVVFNYPNIAALAEYLASLLPAVPAPASAADLDNLSADELAGLLERELKALSGEGEGVKS
ncbi:MAG TPA: MupA/Atu3671 family FMN-dependent luciferase-like monooxygenase [Opitutaceae bacterium]